MVGIEVACRNSEKFTLIKHSDILSNSGNGKRTMRLGWQVSFRHNGSNHRIGLLPDQVFGLKPEGKTVQWFFLEADRGTMPIRRTTLKQTSITKKIMGYNHSAEQRIPWQRFKFPTFRVLCVSPSEYRLKGIKEACSGSKRIFLAIQADSLKSNEALERWIN